MVELSLLDGTGQRIREGARFDRVPVVGETIWIGQQRYSVASVEFGSADGTEFEAYVVIVSAPVAQT